MIPTTHSDRYCILGAGASGLAVAKNFLAAKIPFDVIEREDDVGGNWYYNRPHSSVYRSVKLVSSKRLTEYTDFPMPEEYPEYPCQEQAEDYLRHYASHFGLYKHIEFNTAVEEIIPEEDYYQVKLLGGELRNYRGVVIANGHNWDPNWPEIPGNFSGEILHSSEYKAPKLLEGRRVLVVGAGNSGCDLAVESAHHAKATFHSTRRGYHYLPKFLHGKPIDLCGERLLRWHLPLWLRRGIARLAIRITLGPPWRVGLPKPDHKLFETHPIINSQLYYCLGHGQIKPKDDIVELCGDSVRFADGTKETVDLILYATGFKISFPFIDNKHLNWNQGCPDLYLNIFHPKNDQLFVVGLIQPDSGQWGLVDYQSQLIARVIRLQEENLVQAARFKQMKQAERPNLSAGIHYVKSRRHLLEVEHFSYRTRLQKLLKQFA